MITKLLELVRILVQEYKTHGISILINSPSIQQFHDLLEHLSKVDLSHVGINLETPEEYFKKNKTTYFNILEEQDLSVGVFCLGQGSSLDLHDHPNMLVLTKYLMGSTQYRSLDLVDRSQQISLPQALYQDEITDVVGKKLEAIVRGERILRAGDISYLTPELGNIHKITALEDTAFLDILLPNYNETDRYCNFYAEMPQIESTEQSQQDEQTSYDIKMKLDSEQSTDCQDIKLEGNSIINHAEHKPHNSSLQKEYKPRHPGDKTTLIYTLPSLDQPIHLVPYKGEKIDCEVNSQESMKESP